MTSTTEQAVDPEQLRLAMMLPLGEVYLLPVHVVVGDTLIVKGVPVDVIPDKRPAPLGALDRMELYYRANVLARIHLAPDSTFTCWECTLDAYDRAITGSGVVNTACPKIPVAIALEYNSHRHV